MPYGQSTKYSIVPKTKRLTPKEQEVLALKAKSGDKLAMTKLIEGSAGLIIATAKRLQNSHYSSSDLVSDGCIGIIKAIQSFNPDKGKFSTYASWYITGAMKTAIADNTRLVRIPRGTQTQIKRHIEGIPVIGNISESEVNNYKYESNVSILDDEFINGIQIRADVVLHDIEVRDEKEKLLTAINTVLDPKSADILISAFGLWNGVPISISSIAKKYRCAKADINVIITESMKKLKTSFTIKELHNNYEEF